jgi:aminopeptidase N
MALRTLENVLGEPMFLSVMHTFFQHYAFAHPTTADFQGVVAQLTGDKQAWFFDGLVYGSGMVNYTLTALDAHSVTVARLGELRLPTAVRVTYAGGSAMTEPWDGVESPHTFSYPNQPPVIGAQIDPNHKLTAETDELDNGRLAYPDLNSWLAVTARLVYNLQSALLALGGF